ncbi:hypothetical protein PYW08_012686 [Mythimna loreyi]|uniref:Uncharacterized protein n=1 Tax=Mythimna loreyi TaxID=667449 RepID=A0ACC2Q1E6_9NEOP|nr:hypothetical protein PYW08_012686 [Mythimna loreyi]
MCTAQCFLATALLFGLAHSWDIALEEGIPTDIAVDSCRGYVYWINTNGKSECNQVLDNYETKDSTKIAREYEGPFCVHGIKVIGQSICKCTAGYTGVRCDASVCDNYCLQGSCNFTDDGLPECRCNAGYSGERCELNVCNGYCLNNGTCSLNEEDEPVCECIGEYEGGRCELPAGVNNVDGPLVEKIEPACQTPGSGLKDDQNNAVSSASKHYTAERNITLADLLANWQKPVATISVVVEVKTNN